MTPRRQTFVFDHVATPIGNMLVVSDAHGQLRALDWEGYENRMQRLLRLHYGDGAVELVAGRSATPLRDALSAYFAGDVNALNDVSVQTGGTPFQREVWNALRAIPAGETTSYGALAKRIGRPEAVRAVGLANGANPVGVVVPCHRVIGADGSLTGYAGGLERKRWLLEHERAAIQTAPLAARRAVPTATV